MAELKPNGGQSALIRQMQATVDRPGSVSLWFLGQSSVVVRGGGQTIYFDPYFSDSLADRPPGRPGALRRAFPPPIPAEQATNADIVCISHEHLDHFDPATLRPMLTVSPQAVVVAPPVLVPDLRALGLDDARIVPAWPERTIQLGPARIVPIPAAHEEFDVSPEYGHRYLGYVVALNGVTLYHAGDTIPYDDLPPRLRALDARLLLLPINGRDWGRHRAGIQRGNMTYREAADLAAEAEADTIIPLHHDLFPWNGEDPGRLADYLQRYHPTIHCLVLGRGAHFRYHAPDRDN